MAYKKPSYVKTAEADEAVYASMFQTCIVLVVIVIVIYAAVIIIKSFL